MRKILYPSPVEYVQLINANIVDNALGGRTSFLLLPSLYQRAFILAHRTGELPLRTNFLAPDESTTTARDQQVNILTNGT